MSEHFVQIESAKKKVKTLYRFYGFGRWKVNHGGDWKTINAIYVPAEVMRIAASHCYPSPILTEIDIARLCGGRM